MDSLHPSISADGRYVAFYSAASNLVAGDTNGASDVFVRDLVAGTTARVSVTSAGAPQGNGFSGGPSISVDGRYVAFYSDASNLVPGDTNSDRDAFVRDLVAGTTARVSVDSAGAQANGFSDSLSISADGRYVAFYSAASNLVAGDTNGANDVFVRDLVAGTTTRVSVTSAGAQGNGSSSYPSISADGRYVGFVSAASNLVLGDTGAYSDVFVRDRVSGVTTRASVDSNGLQAIGESWKPSISGDGRFVTFHSAASNLVVGDTNIRNDVFLRDLVAGTTARVSVDSAEAQGNDNSSYPRISSDGRYVAFFSAASNLVAGDTNGQYDAFVRDLVAGTTTRVSVDSAGAQGNGSSYPSSISTDGRYVAFYSFASNLVSGDTNGKADVFLRDNGETSPLTISNFKADPSAFSPNGDGTKDTTTFTATITDASPPIAWTLDIKNVAGLVVRSFSGSGASSPVAVSQVWDGKDANGLTVPDGNYTATLKATDHWGNVSSSTITVSLDTFAPFLKLIAPLDGSNSLFSQGPIVALAVDHVAGLDASSVGLSIRDTSSGVEQHPSISFDGPVIRSAPVALLPGSDYQSTLTISDLAGNFASRTSNFGVITGSATVPRVTINPALPPSEMTPDTTSDTYAWTNVPIGVAPLTVNLSRTIHPGGGAVVVEIGTADMRVIYSLGGVDVQTTPTENDVRSIHVPFEVPNLGPASVSTAPHAGQVGTVNVSLPKGASNVRLVLDAAARAARFATCADPTTVADRCSSDPLLSEKAWILLRNHPHISDLDERNPLGRAITFGPARLPTDRSAGGWGADPIFVFDDHESPLENSNQRLVQGVRNSNGYCEFDLGIEITATATSSPDHAREVFVDYYDCTTLIETGRAPIVGQTATTSSADDCTHPVPDILEYDTALSVWAGGEPTGENEAWSWLCWHDLLHIPLTWVKVIEQWTWRGDEVLTGGGAVGFHKTRGWALDPESIAIRTCGPPMRNDQACTGADAQFFNRIAANLFCYLPPGQVFGEVRTFYWDVQIHGFPGGGIAASFDDTYTDYAWGCWQLHWHFDPGPGAVG